ncbi:hypothetical protein [Aureimonas sp. SK2]|uniref:glycoside hydrolase family 65 protein n=1 Tax=Aureimonas sp. SK2 TaxID=3015992 RepID=UPI002444B455|nr:hypothetical protein [Aureimonas sp. SK2]
MTFEFPQPSETAPSGAFEIVFDHYDPEDERRRESLLSLGNGVLHCRSSAPECPRGERHYPGSYRAGIYARLTGRVEGEDVAVDSLANLPDWLPLAFSIEGSETVLSPDTAEILSYRQSLDMRSGLLTRTLSLRDEAGRETLIEEQRFVSMAAPHLAALRTRATPLNWSGTLEIRSGIGTDPVNELAVTEGGYDPEAVRILRASWPTEECLLVEAETLGTGVRVAVAARTWIAPGTRLVPIERQAGFGHRATVAVSVGLAVTVEKIGAVYTGRDDAIGSPADAARESACRAPDFDRLRDDHERAWAQLWHRSDLRIDNDNLARAAALHAFHLLQTASPHGTAYDAGIPSRGWQEAYHGQIFWDETLSFPFLSLRFPEVARSALIHRARRLGAARMRAAERGATGALYPWRSGAAGFEETPAFQENPMSGRWHRDDTRLQFHVGSAVAYNVWQYYIATRDLDFMAGYGAEMLIEVARAWAALAEPHPEHAGRLTLRGIVGPDEFHTRYPDADEPGLADNVYTNVMAAWTLRRAAEVLDHLPACDRDAIRSKLRLADEEFDRWRDTASRLHLPRDADGLFLPFEGFDRLEPFDLEAYEAGHPGERIDWSLEAQGLDVNAFQVLKQAQFAMLPYLFETAELVELLAGLGCSVSAETIARTVEGDFERTSHDSSLSDLVYAGALLDTRPERAWEMFRDALHPDEKSGHSGTEKGVHLGAMAATLDILQRMFLGLRPSEAGLRIDPAPPPSLGRIRAHVLFRFSSLRIELDGTRLAVSADPANRKAVPLIVEGSAQDLEPGASLAMTLRGVQHT